ncbi:MAG: tryptophan synthase subunit alpha [Deltaproteobacteria bacterium]|nr:tryptophan synthase subunit alpha [Deltaproteobacteria bacterium]
MNRIEAAVEKARARNEGLLMPFVVLGDPDPETSDAIIDAILKAEPDILEFGFAFSDPPADGPVIQAADRRALRAGMTVDRAFRSLARVRAKSDRPIALLIYYNLILNRGVDAFYAQAAEVGVDAVLVADVPVDEAAVTVKAAKAHGVLPIFIVSELTTDERLQSILEVADGYLYLVARIGVTGAQTLFDEQLASVIARIRHRTSLPILAGFGISTPDHVRAVLNAGADGAICGSALVQKIQQNMHTRARMLFEVEAFCRKMKDASKKTR